MIEVAAEYGRANASLNAGYGYTGILIAFLARFNPLAIMPMALLLGGLAAAGGLMQRRMDLPDATVQVLRGHDLRRHPDQRHDVRPHSMVPAAGGCLSMAAEVRTVMAGLDPAIYARSTVRRWPGQRPGRARGCTFGRPTMTPVATVAAAMLAGSLRVSTPFLFVSHRRVPDREIRPHQSGQRRRARARRHGCLRDVLRNRQSMDRPARRRCRRDDAGRPARCGLLVGPGQRRGHGHRHHAGRHRHRVLLRQTLCAAQRTVAAGHPISASGPTRRTCNTPCCQPAVLSRHRRGHRDALVLPRDARRPAHPHRRRQPGRRARARSADRPHALPRHRRSAAAWPASAARSCRCTTPEAGTRACRPARA